MNKKNKILLMGTIVLLLVINVVTAYLYYAKKVVKIIDKSISKKKEQHDITDMHEIENITEEIEKGKIKR